MVTVRIVSGCYGARIDGKHSVIDKGQTVDVHEDEAAYLVEAGVAVVVKEPVLNESAPGTDKDDGSVDDVVTGKLDEKDLQEMTVSQLKKLAADCGLKVGRDLRTKEKLIKALAGLTVSAPAEEDDGEEPPSLGAEAPVI